MEWVEIITNGGFQAVFVVFMVWILKSKEKQLNDIIKASNERQDQLLQLEREKCEQSIEVLSKNMAQIAETLRECTANITADIGNMHQDLDLIATDIVKISERTKN